MTDFQAESGVSPETRQKYAILKELLAGLGRVAVAFSAGVDSTFLLKTAHDVLGDDAAAFTAATGTFPAKELDEAADFCRAENIRLIRLNVDVFSIPGFRENPPDRCYICKKAIFGQIISSAGKLGFNKVAEGSNTDDAGDYRPGMRALRELGVLSPMKETGLSKSEIRTLSKELGLSTWNKPSFACLATRIAYGEEITEKKLRMTELAERALSDRGFSQYRVRIHGDSARIELPRDEIRRFADDNLRDEISGYFHALGFRFVSLDLDGYRTGSMNAGII